MWVKGVRAATAAAVLSSLLSVFLSGLALALALLFCGLDCYQRRRLRFELPPFTLPLLVYLSLVCVSILFSPQPAESLLYLKKLLKFSLVFLLFHYFRRRELQWTLAGVMALAGASALYALLQYFWLMEVDLLHRITGFMSHWMTFSGQMMLSLFLLAAPLVCRGSSFPAFGSRPRRFGWTTSALLPLLALALLLTFTRSAWIGTVGGMFFLLVWCRPRWLLLAAPLLVLGFLALPSSFHQRLASGWDPADTTTRVRLELLETGWGMVRAHPWTGVGPRMIPSAAEEYRRSREFPDWAYQHLHNNLLQVAAETGVPALVAWLALWLRLAWDFLGLVRKKEEDRELRVWSLAGLAALLGFHLAGLFEYNFGDSELLTLLLFCVTAPYVASKTATCESSPLEDCHSGNPGSAGQLRRF